MFSFFKEKIQSFFGALGSKIAAIFSGNRFDKAATQELFALLVGWDLGFETSQKIVDALSVQIAAGKICKASQVPEFVKTYLEALFNDLPRLKSVPEVVVLLGINGAGKTTTLAKLAWFLKEQGRSVLMVAGDTFRAAAVAQLEAWQERVGANLWIGKPGQDPASVIFDGCNVFIDAGYNNLLIDTAGRLHTKENLVKELEKIGRVISKQCAGRSVGSWLVLDSTLGQSCLQQAIIFKQAAKVDGIILTKVDSGSKGGIIFAIADQLKLPVFYLTVGEGIENIKPFDVHAFVNDLFV